MPRFLFGPCLSRTLASSRWLTPLLLCSLLGSPQTMAGQTGRTDAAASEPAAPMAPRSVDDLGSAAELPDAPSEVAASTSSSAAWSADPAMDSFAEPQAAQKNPPGTPGSPLPRTASPTDTVVAAGQTAPHQTSRDKILSSLKDSISPFSFASDTISAGYSHLTNGRPNYGTDGDAFAQRFGAAVARGTSQTLFANGALAPILHEDTRYYQLGPGHSLFRRTLNAAEQPLVARTDGGRRTPNIALLGGYAGAAVLTQVYYPPRNQTAGEIFATWASSLGGAAIGYAVDEFLPQILQAVHLQKLSPMRP